MLLHRLTTFRAELADLAFSLESQGRRDAADLANAVGGRIAELAAGAPEGWTTEPAESAD